MSRSNCYIAFGVLLAFAPITRAQAVSAPYDIDYAAVDLGAVGGISGSLGGLTIAASDPNTLLLGAGATTAAGIIYAFPLVRDAQGSITGLGAPTSYASSPQIDGGLTFGPSGVLFATGYPNNTLLQYLPGSTAPSSTTVLTPLGVASSTGTCMVVPPGFPGAGQFKLTSYNGNSWYTLPLLANAQGLFDVGTASSPIPAAGGPAGIVYPPPGSPQIADYSSVLICEYSTATVSIYSLDANGDPIPATRAPFLTGLSGVLGAVSDPVTGDLLFSTFGAGNRIVRVSASAQCGFFQSYGQACGSSPQISGGGCPEPGAAITIDISGGPANAMGSLGLGTSQVNLPILNCTVLVAQDAAVGLTLDAAGAVSFAITIPNLPAFQSWTGYWQAGFFDAASPLGFTLTGGLEMLSQ
ncbi:MAG: hypothetical protein AB8H80_23465 [Planctomycetota bacterium]